MNNIQWKARWLEGKDMRECGVLLHITSLPEKGGIGTLGREAYRFVDFIRESGMNIWQVLPVGPVGYGESPYQSVSTYAGNPMMIDLNMLEEEGILPEGNREFLPDSDKVDFEAVRAAKEKALRAAYAASKDKVDMAAFRRENPWVEDYALFMALKMHFGGGTWQKWPLDIRLRKADEMEKWRKELKEEAEYYIFVQCLFFAQWFKLRAYANENGVKLFGDMPIYVAEDSSDMWANPDVFQVDEERRPLKVAGVPPDYFSADGQLWGNPLYDWKKLKKQKFHWWMERMRAMAKLYDLVRVDHFIGFANYYSIEYGAPNAREGKWIKAPGKSLFRRLKKEVPQITVIAEDLGEVNNRVKRLLKFCGYPGMKVLTFGLDGGAENPHAPHNFTENSVIYTGTHDNDTVLGVWNTADEGTKESARKLFDIKDGDDVVGKMVEAVWASPSQRAIVPMQDLLRIGSEGRMNLPGTVGGWWSWRMTAPVPETVKEEIIKLNKKYNRGGKME